jgi:hypothetical protein
MDCTGQIAPIRVSLTSSLLKSSLLAKYYAIHARASKTRYLEKFKINISTRCIQTKPSTRKRLEYKEYFTLIADQNVTKSLEDIQLFLNMKYRMFGQAVSKYMIVQCSMF